MTTIPVIDTERLTLRAPRLEDFEPYAAYFASARAELERGRRDRAGAWKEFSAVAGQWLLRGYGGFSIEDRANGGYLGEVGVFHEDNYPEPELGWMVVAAAEGRGIAHEAAVATRRWAYRALGLKHWSATSTPRTPARSAWPNASAPPATTPRRTPRACAASSTDIPDRRLCNERRRSPRP